MARPKKITWAVIFQDFKSHFPNLKKQVTHWRPYDYATIELWFKDKSKATYDYDAKEVKFVEIGKE